VDADVLFVTVVAEALPATLGHLRC
jgi:hypothetical protein